MKENPFSKTYWLGSVDPRPLALFRILFGAVALFDLVHRIPDVALLLSDQGLTPRGAVATLEWSWSLFRFIGAPWAVMLVYLGGLVAVAALLVGYHTRLAQVATFVFMHSLHARNPAISAGPDAFMGTMSFWLLFADSGAAWSVDRRLGKRTADRVPALGLRLLQWQFGLLCVFASAAKWSAWGDGLGVYRVAQIREYATPLATALIAAPWVCVALNWLVLGLEMAVPVLLIPLAPLSPRWTRAAGILAGSALFLGIQSFVRVGCYPALMMAGLALFALPEWFGPGTVKDEGTTATPGLRRALLAVGGGQLGLVAWSLLASRCGLREGRLVQYELKQLDLHQTWRMFAQAKVPSSGWWTDLGTLADGRKQEILATTVPGIVELAARVQWKEMRQQLKTSDAARRLLVSYACREFDRKSPVPASEIALELHAQTTHNPGEAPNPERVVETYRLPCRD